MSGGMGGGMGNGMQDMTAQSSVVNNTAATALQTALAAIMTAGAGLAGTGQQQTGNAGNDINYSTKFLISNNSLKS